MTTAAAPVFGEEAHEEAAPAFEPRELGANGLHLEAAEEEEKIESDGRCEGRKHPKSRRDRGGAAGTINTTREKRERDSNQKTTTGKEAMNKVCFVRGDIIIKTAILHRSTWK